MALTERQEIAQRNVLVDGEIEVRVDTVIERDGEEIARFPNRHVLVPGASFTREHPMVQRLATAEHTSTVVAAYRAKHPVQ